MDELSFNASDSGNAPDEPIYLLIECDARDHLTNSGII